MAIELGAGHRGDELPVVVTGMVLVSAMAIQNAASRVHLASAPPTTLVTGTTTQIMIDVADLIRGMSSEATVAAKTRLSKMISNVVAFAVGCGAGAFIYSRFSMQCFVVPPVLAAIPILLSATKEQV